MLLVGCVIEANYNEGVLLLHLHLNPLTSSVGTLYTDDPVYIIMLIPIHYTDDPVYSIPTDDIKAIGILVDSECFEVPKKM